METMTYTPYEYKVEEYKKTEGETEFEALVKLTNVQGKQGWEFVAPLDYLASIPGTRPILFKHPTTF
ncbi:MAG: hypothetical protein ACLPQS_15565 [Acidimicrobiales bacterium]